MGSAATTETEPQNLCDHDISQTKARWPLYCHGMYDVKISGDLEYTCSLKRMRC